MKPHPQQNIRLITILLIIISLVILASYLNEKEDGPISLLQRGFVKIITPFQSAANSAVKPLKNFFSSIGNLTTLRDENIELKKELEKLKKQKFDYEQTKEENEQLRKILKFKKKITFESLPATVIGKSNNIYSSMIVDKGKNDGVFKNMPVLSGEGLVGKIVASFSDASIVQLITNARSSVGAKVKGSNNFGIVEGSLDGELFLKFLVRKSKIRVGDEIVTSGLGGIFPKDLHIGKILKMERNTGALEPIIKIVPKVLPAKLEQLFIITNPPSEITETMQDYLN